ncbi:Gfo/Idh/MocA family oxidoreductase [Lignipirellula cremea]|uniref:Inositol 2-dehydrogenase n=1 Tax=Lignipirellula cremea TaxID=2528010 RepID=A0A518DTN4_9BACT|nr:Gfo/Idh/MocA family oxidoreductase [Lignipirellula cremea]QDU95200.1 Inositol 2-dehydrogenase [Lignipirellula cremea]
MSSQFQRRDFLKASAALAAVNLLPSRVQAASANGVLRTAHIGVGGMGGSDLNSVSSHKQVEVAALCDVDAARLKGASMRHPNAKTFVDYREMITALGDQIDAVVVSTPDHTHAPAAMRAMLAGKPVYCQKPLTHEVFEARQLRKIAEQKKLVTQMGIQVHSSNPYRRAVQMIQSGVIGKVSQVHAWSGKNWGYDGAPPISSSEAPPTLDWDLWLGVTSDRPYMPGHHPGSWRKLIDFGTGTLGDMGVHIFDTPYAALELTAPKWAKTTCRPPTGYGHPERNLVEYEFPGTKHTTDSMSWKWYDGSFAPPKSDELDLPADLKLPSQGSLFVGEGGYMLLPHVSEPVLFPQKKFADYQPPVIDGQNHYHQWVDACLGEGQTSASFSYAGPLTEALLLGVVANRFPDTKLEWDAAALEVTNLPEANKLIKREYRKGFEVENLS